jgi:regulatory protein
MPGDALQLAIAALRRRERSAAELETWLRERGVEGEELEETLERLRELGELDDLRFARRYTDDKRELAGWGTERIHEALLARGIPPEHVEAALETESDAAQVERAAELLGRRGQRLCSESDRARALGFLTRRGYGYELAHEAIRAYERRSG